MNDGFWLIAGIALLFVSQNQEPATEEPEAGFIAGGGGGAPGPTMMAKILGGLGLNGDTAGDVVNGAPVGMIAEDPTPAAVGGPGTFWDAILAALGLGENGEGANGAGANGAGANGAGTNGAGANGGEMGSWQGPSEDVDDLVQVQLVATDGGFSITGDAAEIELLVADPTKGLMLSGWGGPLGAPVAFPQGMNVLVESLIQHGPPINGDDGDDPNEILYDPVQLDLVATGGRGYSVTGDAAEIELLEADPTRGVVVSGWGGPLGAPVHFPQGIEIVTQSLIEHGVPIGGDDS